MSEQPRDFGFGEDETMLRDAARKFFTDQCGPDKIHTLVAQDPNINRPIECIWDQDLWRQVTELGWTAVCVPEAAGGVGMPLVAAVAITEEAGRVAFPSPLISTYCGTAVLKACGAEAANNANNPNSANNANNVNNALADIAAGAPVSLAITNEQGSWASTATDVAISGSKLNGAAWFVQDAQKAARFIVSARGKKGVGLYLVEANAPGLDIIADGIIDLTRDQAHIRFDKVDCIELASEGAGDQAIDAAMPSILTLLSADMVGAGEWLLQTTVEYAKTRVQFDRPLGFFQAVKHPLVNVMLSIDQARSLTYNAACSIDCEESAAELNARMAKAQASDMAVFSSSRAVQFHGGIGFTWECYVQIFFKRQMHNQVLFGDGKYQRARLADMVIGQVA